MNILIESFKSKISPLLSDDTPETPLKKKVGLFILFLIILSSLEVILESVESLNTRFHYHFIIVDAAISVIFSIEYFLRVWTYNVKGEKPTLKQRISHLFSFYMIIDLVSILPFFMSLISYFGGFGFVRIIRILRLFRLLKITRYSKSQNLVINAIKNKGKELILSSQVVLFLTIIMSAILYHIENNIVSDNFKDIVDAFIWSVSKFIGGVGGYGDFEPVTFWGKFIATLVGLLGIALFAVPAGIIGAGFVEEIENIKNEEINVERNRALTEIFQFDHLESWKRGKREIGLPSLRRKVLKISDAKLRLLLTDQELIEIARDGKGIRLKNFVSEGVEQHIIESFLENRSYGTFTNKNANTTIISVLSADQPFLGHFSYSISEYLNANYISVEKCSISNFIPRYKVDLRKQDCYLDNSKSSNQFVNDFKNDLLEVVADESLVIYFACGARDKGDFNLLNGGKKGEYGFRENNGLFSDTQKLKNFMITLNEAYKKINPDAIINTHENYGNDGTDEFQWMLRKNRNANILGIYITAKMLNSKADTYLPLIKCLGDSIKNELIS